MLPMLTMLVNRSILRRTLHLSALSGIALVLSLAGIYAVTFFAVTRRTREIGIRVALGADARGVVAAILGRPITHVATGILIGGCLTGALAYSVMRGSLGVGGSALIVAYAALMLVVLSARLRRADAARPARSAH